MTLKQLTSPSGEPIILDNSKVIAVIQTTTRAASPTTPILITCTIFYSDLDGAGFVVLGDSVTVLRQLGLTYTTTK